MNAFALKSAFLMPLCAAVLGCATPAPPAPHNPEKEIVYMDVVKEVEVVRQVQVEGPSETLLPFTLALYQRLKDAEIGDLQFILFGRISLERESNDTTVTTGRGGRAELAISHVRDIITLKDTLEGQVLEITPRNLNLNNLTGNTEVVLSVAFEESDEYRLPFSSRTGEPDSYFYLKYDRPPANSSLLSEEKGTLRYGNDTYKVKFSTDRPPYLMIRLSQNINDKIVPREATGRKVGNQE